MSFAELLKIDTHPPLDPMPFEPKNKLAEKPEAERLTSFLHIRAHVREKSAWVKAAKGHKLADWVRRTLNAAAQHTPEPHEHPPD